MSILGKPKRKQDIKKSAIKKFADSYRVGIAYMGLAELKLNSSIKNISSDYDTFNYTYVGIIEPTDSPYGLRAYVSLDVRQKHYKRDSAWELDLYSYDYSKEEYDVLAHNIEGMVSNEFKATIVYDFANEIAGEDRVLYRHDVGTYYSIEDVLDAISTESETAWGEVTIRLRDYAEELRQNRSIMDVFPKTIELNVPDNSLVLTEGRFVEGEWLGHCEYDISGINLHIRVVFRAIAVVDGELYHPELWGHYGTPHDSEVGGYSVEVYGRITDGNTQTSEWLRNPRRTSWAREFENQGAVTLDGAKAIAEANIREVYQEFMDYVNSERNYVTQSNGRGYARTTINTNEWNYNFGDTPDDINYLEWQESEHGYPYEASTKKSKSVPQFSTVVAKLRKKE